LGSREGGYRCLWYEVDGKNSTTIKMSFIWQIPLKEGIGGERRPKDRVKDRVALWITLLFFQSFQKLKVGEQLTIYIIFITPLPLCLSPIILKPVTNTSDIL
jgi:hypothetical protein